MSTVEKSSYEVLYSSAIVIPSKVGEVANIASRLTAFKAIYQMVEKSAAIPWWVIGILHSLEASQNFKTHLHNGDDLKSRTIHAPSGRPKAPPKNGHAYEWVESAIDAVSKRQTPLEWTLSKALEFLERYNGLGYRFAGINTPYLWSYTQHYTRGKYGSDGIFDPMLKSNQTGAAAILKALEAQGKIPAFVA